MLLTGESLEVDALLLIASRPRWPTMSKHDVTRNAGAHNISRCSHRMMVTDITHTHAFNGTFWGLRVSRYQKGKTNLDFTKARDNGISWAICKSAPRSREITMPASHHSVFYRPDALPAAEPTVSRTSCTESFVKSGHVVLKYARRQTDKHADRNTCGGPPRPWGVQ